jgi:hypothetical protein
MTLATIQAPAQNVVATLNAPAQNLVYLLDAWRREARGAAGRLIAASTALWILSIPTRNVRVCKK